MSSIGLSHILSLIRCYENIINTSESLQASSSCWAFDVSIVIWQIGNLQLNVWIWKVWGINNTLTGIKGNFFSLNWEVNYRFWSKESYRVMKCSSVILCEKLKKGKKPQEGEKTPVHDKHQYPSPQLRTASTTAARSTCARQNLSFSYWLTLR